MEYVKLGSTDLTISQIGFGCEPLGGYDWGNVDEHECMRAVSEAVDFGVTLFDTADIYGLGRSEENLSRALGARRHDVIIATKGGVNWLAGPEGRAKTFHDSSPAHMREALEGSLRRLRVDCIALYQIHWPDSNTRLDDTIDALARCHAEGKFRLLGCCNFPPDLLRDAAALFPIHSLQLNYNLAEQDAYVAAAECCRELGISILAYGVLAQGMLTGKYGAEATFPESDRRSRAEKFRANALHKYVRLADRLNGMARRHAKTAAQVATRWVLETPGVACAIVGIKTISQIHENTGATNWRLTEDDRLLLDQELAI